MSLDITIKNYRCFSHVKPLHITIDRGFTAFIGPNNSGKSTALRFFFEFRNLFTILRSIGSIVNALTGRPQGFSFPRQVVDPAEIFHYGNTDPLQIEFNQRDLRFKLTITVDWNSRNWVADAHYNGRIDPQQLVEIRTNTLRDKNGREYDFSPFIDEMTAIEDTLYIGAFRNAINLGTQEAYFDISIGQSFIDFWKNVKSGPLKENTLAALNITEDIKTVFGFERLEINPTADGQNLQIILDGRSYLLGELGSGLAQFIVVLVNAAVKRRSYILIDEPELNLHPQLQIDFLTTLASYSTKGLLFCTHSYGLATVTAERIYTFRKAPNTGYSVVSPLEATENLPELLGELSFRGYSELGFNCVLLVEGVSDVRTILQFLRKYGKAHEVVLLPMGGAQLIHPNRDVELYEIMRITRQVYALIDSEKPNVEAALPDIRQRFRDLCERVGITCHALERRAIENYLSGEAIKAVLGQEYEPLEPYELLGDSGRSWSKRDNWRIARAMRRDDIEGTDLGDFLEIL